MRNSRKLVAFIVFSIAFLLSCDLSSITASSVTSTPIVIILTATSIHSEPVPPTSSPQPATAEPVLAPSETPSPSVESSPTEIVHKLIPPTVFPVEKPQTVYDQESRLSAKYKYAYAGDEFLKGKFERPFDQQMNYLPYIDIIQTNLYRNKGGDFFLMTIYLQEDPALLPDARIGLGIEMDEDLDGRGDYLVWTLLPASTTWSVEGVSVLKDANQSVGASRPLLSDAPVNGDGYELAIFKSGVGSDPDLAWSRISPESPKQIQIAFKKTVLETSPNFLWASWTVLGEDPFGLFDHNDTYTFEQAGSPMKEDKKYFPLKDLFAIDNTCRSASGFSPRGDEPGLCPRAIKPTEESSQVCTEMCFNFGAQRVCYNICE